MLGRCDPGERKPGDAVHVFTGPGSERPTVPVEEMLLSTEVGGLGTGNLPPPHSSALDFVSR